ncbi:tetratricopeptide repeat-containing glycosyltransferase family protein [Ramlibacter sp.]|uniref:tetratricopeptide repeat-containing glycosyltransferase family protein n=1 Tax=Ramlibacter sp. TaxID=1917967 RepID=UPI002D7182F8|nr:tetratricopeptide repeat-containing glycosyltransferase family protein [Ramlibacter sp.]HYD76398.1 tetratricopeptide repeat-containing glycosyltransferase family protein [Ramlibacter sp.]
MDPVQATTLLFADQARRLLQAGEHAQALAAYRRLYEEIGDRDRYTVLHYGQCLARAGELEPAAARFREAAVQEPGFLEAHLELSGVLWRLGEFQDSLSHARAGVHLAPEHPQALRTLGVALLQARQADEAERQLRRALELDPDAAATHVELARCLWLAGRLSEAWGEFERRWDDPALARRPPFYEADLEWAGPSQPLQGRRLLVYAEPGHGDTMQALRYLPLLQQLGAELVCVVPTALVPLVESSFPGVECVRPDRDVQADLHAALLDLPGRFGTTLQDIPSPRGYLRLPAARVREWQERLAPWQDRFRLGLAWRGAAGHPNDRNRSLALSQLRPLLAMEGVQAFSLQKDDGGAWTDVAVQGEPMVDLAGEWRDFADSAAMLQQLDLVLTVDTATAHLGGALGVPTWVMLPPNADARWLLEREDSPWYASLRLFRRGPDESREQQVARVVQALAAHRQRHLAQAHPPGRLP